MDKETIKNERIIIIGVGGTGSFLVELLSCLGARNVMLIDGDIVEKRNLLRQNFSEEHIGKSKAKVLAERYDYEHYDTWYDGSEKQPGVLISCVDNNEARRAIRKQQNQFKLFCANETFDAEAYWGINETYKYCYRAFDEEYDEAPDQGHCNDETADPQTKVANLMSASFAIMLLLKLNKKLFMERNHVHGIMHRSSGGHLNSFRIGDIC